MKKYIVSLLVILSFGTYVLAKRSQGSDNVSVTPPPGFSISGGTPTPSPTTDIASGGTPPTPTAPTTSPTPKPTSTPAPTPTPTKVASGLKDGTFTGSVADAFYGNIQVQAVISGGKITDVVFLQYPNDRSTSREINGQAMPYLKAEAIQAQSANVDIISGATDSSLAFRQSLASALSQAKS